MHGRYGKSSCQLDRRSPLTAKRSEQVKEWSRLNEITLASRSSLSSSMVLAAPVSAQKLMLAHVAVNPSQGMLHLAKDSGILAKYGFTADVLLIPGTPRTIQALIAGDFDYVAAGAPASLRARAQGADVTILSTLANSSAQRVFIRPDSKLNSFKELKGKIIGVTQYGSGGDTFLRGALAQARHQGIRGDDLADGRHARRGAGPGVRAHRSRRARRFGFVVGFSRPGKTIEGRRARAKWVFAAPMRRSRPPIERSKADRAAVVRFMQAYLETVHFFQTNKAGTARILGKIHARRQRRAYLAVVR